MKTIAINEFGGRDKLQLMELPVPEPGPGEVLVKVMAAGVNPADCKIREGKFSTRLPHHFPLVLGWDAAGIVAKAGSDVVSFLPGDEVYAYCRKPVVQGGTYAEFVTIPQEYIARKPSVLSFIEAASVPLAGLTAYQSLFDAAGLGEGETILIHAAAGGVGSFAVQLAALHGAYSIGTARSIHHEYLFALGAKKLIDYSRQDFREEIHSVFPGGIDIALDFVGRDTTFATMDVLKENGRLVSILQPRNNEIEEKCNVKNIRYTYVFVKPDNDHLKILADLFDAKKIKTHVSTVFRLEDAARAHELIEKGHSEGKIVLEIP